MKYQKIKRERILPYPGQLLVEIGDKVEADDIIAELDYVPGKVYKIPVASNLSLPYDKLKKALVIEEGQHVQKGDMLAINNIFYKPYVSISPVEGVIGIISKHLGMLYIRDYIPLDNNSEADVVYDLNKLYPDEKANILSQKILVNVGNLLIPSQVVFQLNKNKRIVNKVYGRVKSIKDNVIVISAIKINSELKAYIPGEIVDTNGHDSVTVEGQVYQLQGAYGLGGEKQGHLKVITLKRKFTEEDIKEGYKGKILFIPSGVTIEAIKAADKLGVNGIITNSLSFSKIEEFAGIDFVPGITGNESINTALLLVKGFIEQPIEKEIIDFVKEYEDKWVSMRGSTHIRAGAIRPELILTPDSEMKVDFEFIEDKVGEGKTVEIKRSGNLHGKKGTLEKIHSQPKKLPSLIKVLVATVIIDGESVTVPLTNLVPAGRLE
ncbi:MAG: hypothetical protein ACLFPS_00930 [Clostridia bacterium]